MNFVILAKKNKSKERVKKKERKEAYECLQNVFFFFSKKYKKKLSKIIKVALKVGLEGI